VQYAFVNVNATEDYNDSNDYDYDDDDDNDTNNIKADNVNCSAKELSMVSGFLLMTECAEWPRDLKHEPVFCRSEAGIAGSDPTQSIDVCVRLFCVCVVLCVGSGLATD
jgi:hypothetical protein